MPTPLLLLAVLSVDPPVPCAAELFRIERSRNANVVVYEARPGRQAGLDPDEPVTASWLLLASKGEREGLGFFEREFAYGFAVRPAAPGPGFALRLRALKQRVIHVASLGGCPTATSAIGGRDGVLKRIYVRADERQAIPSVISVELFGVDPATGEALYEKIVPGASGR